MNLSLKPETEKLIRERIDRGEYKDAAEFVDEAIRYIVDVEGRRRNSTGSSEKESTAELR